MSGFEQWVLGYLLNSLWQIPMVFIAAWMVSRIAANIGPHVEHRVWVSALVMEMALPACTWRMDGLVRSAWSLFHGGSVGVVGLVQMSSGPGIVSANSALRLSSVALEGVAAVYGGALVYCAARLAWGVWRTDGMCRNAESITLKGHAGLRWDNFRRVFNVRTASMARSPRTSGPVTVGMWHGVMLVPPGFLESIPPEDLDAVLAHECAHMRRRDFAKNMAYGVMTLPVAYHPLVWLTRARVSATREMVCDAMAAEAVAGRKRYVRSLLRLASSLVQAEPAKTLHAIGIFDANIFERRVMRLAEKHVEVKNARRIVVAAACLAIGLATCASALALRMDVTQSNDGQARMVLPATEFQAIYKKPPVYPTDAMTNHNTLDGPVVLAVTVSKDGMPTEVHVTKSLRPDYDESALVAVRDWRWQPYVSNGNAVAVDTTVTINYIAP